jgi:hypothetical protein
MKEAARLIMAELTFVEKLPNAMRDLRNGVTADRIQSVLDDPPVPTPEVIEAASAVLRQLGTISDETRSAPELVGPIAAMRLFATMVPFASGNGATPDRADMRAAMTELRDYAGSASADDQEQDLASLLDLGLQGLLVATDEQADADALAGVLDNALELHAGMDENPLQAVALSLMARFSGLQKWLPQDDQEMADFVALFERVCQQLRGHPNRMTAITRLTVISMLRAVLDHSVEPLQPVKDLLMTDQPEMSAVDTGMGELLLGWVKAVEGTVEGDTDRIDDAVCDIKAGHERLPAGHPMGVLIKHLMSLILF